MILLLLISGALGIQNGFQTHVMKLPLFPKRLVEMLSWMFFFGSCWGGSGALAVPFWHHFGGPWDPNGVLFDGFWGSGGVLGRLGRAVCAKTPSLR